MALGKRITESLIILVIVVLGFSGIEMDKPEARMKILSQGSVESGVQIKPRPSFDEGFQFINPVAPCEPQLCDPQEYLDFLEEAIPALWNNKGVMLAELKKHKPANDAYDESIRLNPKVCYVWYNKSLNYHNWGDNPKAIECANKAIELKPDFYQAWGAKGNALFRNNQPKEAVVAHSEAIRINPYPPKLYYNRGVAYLKTGEIDKALDDVRTAVQRDGKFKQTTAGDTDYEKLKNDPRFKELVK